ncbi:hypothetical protein ACHAWF_006730, partial [Thalassiosira exigua]
REVRPAPRDPNAEEDDVELYYPTTRRAFALPIRPEEVLEIRQTSFGCGKLGATVWPSAIALAALLASEAGGSIEGKRVLELGSGCGLPSLVAKEICGAREVLATDYWEEAAGGSRGAFALGGGSGDRLVPKDLFGINLAHNLGKDLDSVKNLDWHDELEVFRVANEFCPNVIVGSDLVYYPMDATPLLQTLEIMLKAENGAEEALLISPLPPKAEREALPEFRSRLESGELGDNFDVALDELEMLGVTAGGDEEVHKLLRISIRR